MIRVIASDLDGTLLGRNHKVAPQTEAAVKQACQAGIHFIITTGRSFRGALQAVEDCDFICDFLTANGAEIRNAHYDVLRSIPLSYDVCADIFALKQQYTMDIICFSRDFDFRIGTTHFTQNFTIPQPRQNFLTRIPSTIRLGIHTRRHSTIPTIHDWTILEKQHIPVYKIDLVTGNVQTARLLREKLRTDSRMALAFSSVNDLEITHPSVQKGPILQQYIRSLGYSMDEVMVFGDSMNDFSMLSMNFGATVAMGQAIPEIKSAAKYITKSNDDFGVASMIHKLLNNGRELI